MSDRTLLDLIPFFEGLATSSDIYAYVADNLSPIPTVYIGAVPTTPTVVPISSIPMSPSPVPAVSSGTTTASTAYVTVSSFNGNAS